MKESTHKVIHILAFPIVFACRNIPHIPGVKKDHIHITSGICVAYVGVVITKIIHQPPILHYTLDFIGYGLHAIGLAPLFKKFKLE